MNRRAFLLGAFMLLLGSLVAVGLRAFAEAAFLASYGPKQMPWLLIATAGGFGVATLGYDALTRRVHARVVDLGLLVVLVAVSGLAPVLLDHGVSPALLVIGVTAASQVANLALWNRTAAAVAGRDARRMLPRAGAAITAGGAIAGLTAGAAIPRLGLAAIPYACAAVTVIVVAICVAQERALVAGGAPGGVPGGPGMPAAAPDAKAPVATITSVQRKLLGAMIVVAALEAIVTTVIDLQFIASVKGRYEGNAVAVALALFYGGTNAVLLVLQVSAVPVLLVTRSLPFTAAIHPLLVIASYIGFWAAPGFATIAGTRTTDQVLRLATSRTSQELALSALPPAPRARWKVLLRGLVWPAGAAATAYVLLVIGPAALRDAATVAAIVIAVAIVWAIAARIAAKRFQTALAAPLGIRAVRVDDPRRIDLETLERWTHATGDTDAKRAALARATLARARIDATDLADHLRHDDAAVRAALFDQLARTPAPTLGRELRAAVAIEDDDRALARGIVALTIANDDSGLARGKQRAGLAREIDETVRSAEVMLHPPDADAVRGELATLVARDPAWATAFVRARRAELPDDVLATVLLAAAGGVAACDDAANVSRANALLVIARCGASRAFDVLAGALQGGETEAVAAIEQIDDAGATALASAVASWTPLARAALARAAGGAPSGASLVGQLVDDRDPEVAHAALRSALAIAKGGGGIAPARIAAAVDAALAALVAHLDARDVIATTAKATVSETNDASRSTASDATASDSTSGATANPGDANASATATDAAGSGVEASRSSKVAANAHAWSACARAELDIATRRCVARLLWAAAVEAAAAGRDPAPIAATARHVTGDREADRKRALDVVQELQTRPAILAAIERWLKPAIARTGDASQLLAPCDAWLARLGGGELGELEPAIVGLRRPPLFASLAGPALAALAASATRRTIDGELFAAGAAGDAMFVVIGGALIAKRAPDERRIELGSVVGELAVLTRAPRAATVVAADGGAELIAIDRATFAAAARRSPELVFGLSATLAGWLAPNRPDLL